MKVTVLYEEKYKKPGLTINKRSLPKLNHVEDNWEVQHAEIHAQAVVEVDGVKMERQTIVVYCKEKPEDK